MSPRLIHIYGPLWITSYGFFLVLSLFVFLRCTLYLNKKHSVTSEDHIYNLFFYGTLGGLLGGKVIYLLGEFLFHSHRIAGTFFDAVTGGFGILGAIIGALVVLIAYTYYYRLPVVTILDGAALYAPLAQAIARWGCFFAGCCHGKAVQGAPWWAVKYSSPASLAPLNVYLYPTQIAMSALSLVIFLLLFFWLKKSHNTIIGTGQLALFYIILESLSRFIIEYWRVEYQPAWSFFSYYQLAALLLAFLGSFLVLFLQKNTKGSRE